MGEFFKIDFLVLLLKFNVRKLLILFVKIYVFNKKV